MNRGPGSDPENSQLTIFHCSQMKPPTCIVIETTGEVEEMKKESIKKESKENQQSIVSNPANFHSIG